ncbi:hypothetical protein BDA96_04G011300 [Sorghum bicolor]|uniref:Uncharacterized protein n=2 Tax=Sorghum bicolor TaxID=4558 RepID=A0A921UH28_SORBI|nr:hypothetical protein BDA96_04G011300 [Sorghum bicolor]OQU84201.1 hypothetical protein SORBI_3004G010101 [Sorghum bicolor]
MEGLAKDREESWLAGTTRQGRTETTKEGTSFWCDILPSRFRPASCDARRPALSSAKKRKAPASSTNPPRRPLPDPPRRRAPLILLGAPLPNPPRRPLQILLDESGGRLSERELRWLPERRCDPHPRRAPCDTPVAALRWPLE